MDGALGFPNRQSEVMGNLATMTSCRSLWDLSSVHSLWEVLEFL